MSETAGRTFGPGSWLRVIWVAGLWLVAAVLGPTASAMTLARGEPAWHAVVNTAVLVAPATVGAYLALRVSRNPVGWLLLAVPTVAAVETAVEWYATSHASTAAEAWAAWVQAVAYAFGPPLIPLFALLFPDGRPVGRVGRWGTRAAIAGVGIVAVLSALAPGPLFGFSDVPSVYSNPLGVAVLGRPTPYIAGLAAVLLVGAAVVAAGTLVVRWRRGTQLDRLAMTAAGTPLACALVLAVMVQGLGVGGEPLLVLSVLVASVGVPVGIGVAVTRYRLYGVDLALATTLAYTVLAVVIVVVYAAVSAAAGLVVGRSAPLAVALSTAAAAAVFAPARGRVLRLVRSTLLGAAGDPERAAAVVSRRLAAIDDPDAMADEACRAVAETLRLPHVRVLPPGEEDTRSYRVPLLYHGTRLGALVVPGSVPASMRRALTRVAEPVSAAVHAASLAGAVRRSRAEIVAAVEDERRRLRRDLHDGLGPRLATLAMGLDTASNRLSATPAGNDVLPLLGRLRDQVDGMLVDVRRIVSDLRPPALDQLGLVAALRLHAAEVAGPAGITVDIVESGDLRDLPAATEVAAYRIVAEAVLNAVKHSAGRRCTVSMVQRDGDALHLTIRDDGRGIPQRWSAGVGMHGMRERAAALGGWVVIVPGEPAGTEVRAWLPAVT